MPPKDVRPRNHTILNWSLAIVLASLILLAGTAGHFTGKFGSRPVGAQPVVAQPLAAPEPPVDDSTTAAGEVNDAHAVSSTAFAPFLFIVPSEDGRELFISAGGVGELGGSILANIGIGPGHDKHSWTMTYSDTIQSYVTTATGFTPGVDASGPLNITTTLGLDTGAVDFNRAYVPASTALTVSSIDGNLQLTLVSTDTFPSEVYIAIVPSYGPPGPVPLGYRLVGSAYSVRASGALTASDKPMSLRLYYNDATLARADPHTLAIFAWDAFNQHWDYLGGRLFYDQKFVSVVTSRLTTYALMAAPTWRDDFDDFGGLNFPDEVSNVTLGGTLENRTLVLQSTATNGIAVSKPITPTITIASWGSLSFTRTVNPSTTTLSIDVLSADGTVLLANVTSGISLAGIDPAQYPSLKLRANLSSSTAGETPALDKWQLTWQVEEYKVYLPVVLK